MIGSAAGGSDSATWYNSLRVAAPQAKKTTLDQRDYNSGKMQAGKFSSENSVVRLRTDL